MSEKHPIYQTGTPPITREAFRSRPCTLPYCDPNYTPPTPDELSGLIQFAGWSQSDVAKLVGVNYSQQKGSTTVRKWRTDISSKEHRDIPYSAWRHLLACAGIVTIEEDLEAIEAHKAYATK